MTKGCELPCKHWELYSGPLQEHKVLVILNYLSSPDLLSFFALGFPVGTLDIPV